MKLSFACVAGAFGASCVSVAFAASSVTEGLVKMPTYPFSDPDPVPCVAEKRYPYFRYDGSTDVPVRRAWTAVVLENNRVKVTILPEIGGKVWGAVDKASGCAVHGVPAG